MAKKEAKKVAKKAIKKIEKKKTAKPVKEKKSLVLGGDVIVHNPTNPMQEFVVASEVADDEQIEAELMGKAMEHYVYSFCEYGCKEHCNHKRVTGMTVAGVNEMSRQLTKKKDSGIKIRIVPDSIKIERGVEENGEQGVSVILIAENMLTGETAIGAKFEPFQKTGRKGKYPNTFALEKAVSKAERNAKRKLIPEKMAIEMIKKFVKQGNVQALPPANQKPAQVQAPQNNNVDYLSKLITMLAREAGVKISDKTTEREWRDILNLFNEYTGLNIKSLKVNQQTAQKYLMDFVNCPIMVNKK